MIVLTIWEMIFEELEKSGINAYPPATHIGECKEKYVVVKQDGSAQAGQLSSQFVYYQFLLYVPQNKYHKLSEYEKEVKKVLDAKLFPMLMPVGSSMPDYYDDEVKAHMRSFQYRNSIRNKHL